MEQRPVTGRREVFSRASGELKQKNTRPPPTNEYRRLIIASARAFYSNDRLQAGIDPAALTCTTDEDDYGYYYLTR